MTSVTEQAIELGAIAIRRAGDTRNNSSKLIEESNRQALAAARTQWPILSAGLRELAAEWVARNPERWHRFGAQRGIEASREAHAEELLRAIQKIDEELGIDD